MIEINSTTINGGLQVVSDYMPSFNSVSINIWIKTGSRFEPKEINGISHFLEHMAFKSTLNRTTQAIAEEFDEIGGEFNACTGREYIIYHCKVLKENADLALDIISDMLLNPKLLDKEIEKEKGVVLQEISQTNDTPDDIIFDKFTETAYPNQPFGRSILGEPDIVQSFTADTLKGYIDKFYCGENMLLAVAGPLKHTEVEKLASKHLYKFNKTYDNSCLKHDSAKYVSTVLNKPENHVCKINRNNLEQINLILGFNGIHSYDRENYYKVKVLASIFGGGMSSRLFQEVRENRGLAYAISSYSSSYSDSGMFSIYSATSPQNIKELITVVVDEINKMKNDGVKDIELSRAKKQCKSSILMSMDGLMSRVSKLGSSFVVHDRYIYIDEIIEAIESITTAQLHDCFCNKILNNAFRPVLAAIGNLESLPDYNEITKLIYES